MVLVKNHPTSVCVRVWQRISSNYPIRFPFVFHWSWVIVAVQSLSHVSLWPHGLQHTRLPCLSPPPGACSNSSPLSQWCYPTISSFVVPFSSCLQSFPASGSFLMRWLFASRDQSTGPSASASVLPVNIQDWFLQHWLVWSLCGPRDSQESSSPQFKSINFSKH